MKLIRTSKTRWQWAIVAIGMWATTALISCAVDEEAPGERAAEETVRERPPAQKKEDAGIHVLGKDKGAPEVGMDCEWWGCPPLEPCGDNHCGPGEQTTCPDDCPGAGCGDGFCGWGETWSSCPADCPPPPFCGDGFCNGSESSWTCPTDCGSVPSCGDGFCNGSETSSSCGTDCGSPGFCGNCICELGELSSCPTDCGVYIPNQPLCPL